MPIPTYALLIGVRDYSRLARSTGQPPQESELAGALNDVRSMAMLTRMMDVPARNIRVLTDPIADPNDFAAVAMGRDPAQNMNMANATFGPATKQGILDGLAWLAEKLEAPGAQGILYFSGHSIFTQAGHPCLCPSDTHRAPATCTSPLDVTDDQVIDRYILASAILSGLDEVVGSDPRLVKGLVDLMLTDPEQLHRRPAGWVKDCARQLGVTPSRAGVTKFMDDVGNLGDDSMSRRALVQRAMTWLPHIGVTEALVESVLHGDPLADVDELRNLISFNKAFYQALRDVPEQNQVHILLETCLQESEGRARHAYYHRAGIPLAHGNIVLQASCGMGQSSNLAVFDNRWHGAFTWAAVSLLSQTAVKISERGRSFDMSYEQLNDRVHSLLQLMDFQQQPSLWSQQAQRSWEVFGGYPTGPDGQPLPVEERLEPVRVREEISAGTSGHIYQIVPPTGSALGWLVVVKDTITVNSVTWSEGKEYWIWTSGTPFPASSFKLVRPPGSATGFGGWLSALNLSQPAGKTWVYGAKNFQGTSSSTQSLNAHYKVSHKLGGATPPDPVELCALIAAGPNLAWRRFSTAPVDESTRIKMGPFDKIVLDPGEEIFFQHLSSGSVTYVGAVLTENPE
ncbi:MAG: caspase family protein [Alphaproteobacteria bacterium]|nr:caspase family protein [Alphaproteobacteria bacterium]